MLSVFRTEQALMFFTTTAHLRELHLVYGIRQAITAGLEIPIRALPNFPNFEKRQRDSLGFGWARIYPNLAVGITPATEQRRLLLTLAAPDPENITEGYYRLQVNDSLGLYSKLPVNILQNGI
ncbi:MAG: carbohydrate porin [Bacillus subtilis]|nr:carbohydrate porin [Bacillus subtilis]